MKPGYKIIAVLLLLLVLTLYRIATLPDVKAPKAKAVEFVTLLKQQKPFAAQMLLSKERRSVIDIESLMRVSSDARLAQCSEIEWDDWSDEKGVYTLHGNLLFEKSKPIPVIFHITKRKDGTLLLTNMVAGNDQLIAQDHNSSHFPQ